jgi:hypothetical protein
MALATKYLYFMLRDVKKNFPFRCSPLLQVDKVSNFVRMTFETWGKLGRYFRARGKMSFLLL